MPTLTTRPTNLGGQLLATAASRPHKLALRTADGSFQLTWSQYLQRASAAARALAGLGVDRGDTVAFWLSNRPEFHVADAAALMLGATPFSVYPTFTSDQAEYVIADAGSRILITERAFLASALAVRDSGNTQLECIVLVDGADARALTWQELLECADESIDVSARALDVDGDGLATLIYTSGTTGPPKGVQLTHRNVMALVEAMRDRLELQDGTRAISWLPMAHIAERLCTHYFAMACGWEVTTCSDPKAIAELLRQVKPGFFFSPPRMWEKLRAAALSTLDAADRERLDAAIESVREGTAPNAQDIALNIRGLVGFDQLTSAVVGAAPCPSDVIEFWHAVGVPLGEVYGMSESTGVATVNPPSAVRIGTAGTPLDGVEVKLSDEGEILIRGEVVMAGYRDAPAKTAETIDAAGWLHSGDVGVFDDDGYLRIVDRIKELIISSAGKNMSPANIESTIKGAGELIGQLCVIGDARPYNTALVTLDPDAAAAFAAREGLSARNLGELAQEDAIKAAVAAQIRVGNNRLARVEQIKEYVLLGVEWLPGGEELTPTMKLRRRPIATMYAAEIEELYS